MLPLVLLGGAALLLTAAGTSGGASSTHLPVKGAPPVPPNLLKVQAQTDTLSVAARNARAYVRQHPELAGQLSALAEQAAKLGRPDVANIIRGTTV